VANIVGTRPTKEAELKGLRLAIAVERKARYADFQGKRSTFSQFMRATADRLVRRFPYDTIWVTVRSLFRQYPNVDVSTRISIVRRAEELIAPYWDNVDGVPNEQSLTASDAAREPSSYARSPGSAAPGSFRSHDFSPGANLTKSASKPANKPTSKSAEKPAEKPVTKPINKQSSGSNSNSSSNSSSSSAAPPSSAGVAQTGSASAHQQAGQKLVGKHPSEIPVQFVKGVGPKLATLLSNLGITTVDQLLRHYPRRHLDFQNREFIKDLTVGEEVSIFGTIRSVGAYQSKRGNMSILNVVISDGTGSLLVTRFVGGKGNKYLLERLKGQFPKGSQVLASGVVEIDDYSHKFKLKNAEVEILSLAGGDQLGSGHVDDDREAGFEGVPQSIHAGRLVPVYALTEGLSLRHLRSVIHNAIATYGSGIADLLPQHLKDTYNLIGMSEAFTHIHFPEDPETKDAARRRLVFDELFAIQLQMAHRRYQYESQEDALSITYTSSADGLVEQLRASLPFKLTGAQERIFQEIARDLASNKPMHRLVQGDVGSGKTIVALLALMVAIENGFQGAMMAPTEILAEQHYRQFQRLVTPLGLKCALVLGKHGVKERRAVRQEILSGQAHIAVGTHALLEDDVEFKNLGLIVIDEQHRFGVKQRARLKAKSQSPELLTMTATPIPRTLALTMHGDLDVSEIDELPPGRKPIETFLLKPAQKAKMWEAVHREIEKGRQAYIVFPLIDESETLAAKAATAEYEKLRTGEFKDLNLGLMHGKLKAQEKDEVMDAFRSGQFHILVSTTVIEVGVDVPNASVMVIENADRFGLAQLHQLRGRVGRGADQSYCYLVSEQKSQATRERLEILTITNDGFVVAEKDLEIRGPGEFLGYRQSGLPDLVLADLVKDAKILEEARNAAIAIMKEDPQLANYPTLKQLVEQKAVGEHSEMMRSG
jgi:ATP-dependent DNA helicase RecG